MKYLITLFIFLVGCSTYVPLDKLRDRPEAKAKSIAAQDSQEARKIINNRKRYLELLFEQSRDPYYDQPKWSEACLAENQIGNVSEKQGELQLLSTLVLDRHGTEGHCTDMPGNKKYYVLYLYCPKASEVLKLAIPYAEDLQLQNKTFCP